MIDYLRTMTNNNISELALENILNAKLVQLVASKNVRFKQYSYSPAMPLGYMCFNFLKSGAGKDQCIRLIDKSLMPFLKSKLTAIIDNYKLDMQSRLYADADRLDAKASKDAKKEADLMIAKIRPCTINIAEATFTGLYSEAEQIEKTGYGALCLKVTELGDVVRAAIKGDAISKEYLTKLKNIADGDIEARLTGGEVRHNVEGIATIAILCSDHNALLKPKEKEWLEDYLDGGMGRRSFTYISDDSSTDINPPLDHTAKEKAQMRAFEISKHLENVFDSIPLNMVCEFSPAAKKALDDYTLKCHNDFNRLIKSNEICAKEALGAFWKVTKLAVVLSVIENPTCNIVDTVYVQKAIDFNTRIQPCLAQLINKKPENEIDLLKKYLLTWISEGAEPLKRKDIFNQGFVKGYGQFVKWFDSVSPEVFEAIRAERGYLITDYTGFGGNTKAIQAKKL